MSVSAALMHDLGLLKCDVASGMALDGKNDEDGWVFRVGHGG